MTQDNNTTNLALVKDVDSGTTTAEDFRVVFVNGPLRVANCWDILNDDDMIGMLSFAKSDTLCANFRGFV
jgi:hypothetical protein